MEVFDIEIFRPSPIFGDRYLISSKGRVKSLSRYRSTGGVSRERYLKASTNHKGYLQVVLCNEGIRKNKTIHRLVALAFTPNHFEGAEVNHIDKNKQNNDYRNLEWATPQENSNHSYKELVEATTKHNQKNYSKLYIFTFPCGKEIIDYNMSKFCRDNNLTRANLQKTLTGERPHHKGFRAKEVDNFAELSAFKGE